MQEERTLKYFMKVRGGNALTAYQASLFGLPYSHLVKKWRKRFGDLTVDEETWQKLLTTVKMERVTPTEGYLYVISDVNNLWKIGISGDVEKRLQALQTGNPYKLKIIAAYKSYREVRALERESHIHFKKVRLEGEWFDGNRCTLEDLENEVLNCGLDSWRVI
jgi:predicted GIY-YIG superfamily endonuclease